MTTPLPTAEFEPLEKLEYGHWRAWRMNIPARLESDGVGSNADATISSWIIEAPWAHPHWSNYRLLIMHLRPLERDGKPFPAPIMYLEGATHELQLHALDPDFKAEDMARTCETRRLTPINFAAQLKLESDEAAVELARSTANDVLTAQLNPDTDFIRLWIARFGGNMVKR